MPDDRPKAGPDWGGYVGRGGRECPYCGDPAPRRLYGDASRQADRESARTVGVPCYCARCGREWWDVYRLESARPAAERTVP